MKEIDSDILENQLELYEKPVVTTKHRKFLGSDAGFTMVELIVVTAIIGVLATLAIPAYNQFIQKIKITRTLAEIRGIEKDVLAYVVDTNTLPNSLNDIGHATLRDPWGNLYAYLNIANGGAPRQDTFFGDLNSDFDLYSLGPDGLTQQVITDANGLDDIVRAGDGGWVGLGENF